MQAPSRLGPYELVEPLRSGGGGSIYRAVDSRDGSQLALKLAHESSPSAALALRREVATLLSLRDANVRGTVRVLASGVDEPRPWFVMELLGGPNLRELARTLFLDCAAPMRPRDAGASGLAPTVPVTTLLPREPRARSRPSEPLAVAPGPRTEPDAVLRILRRIAQTLSEVHALGILHGDLTPSNIVLRGPGDPVLLDFGTSFATFERTEFREPARLDFVHYGTPGYAAPELLLGKAVDLRCDIYGLGCIIYDFLFGRPVFAGPRVEDVVQQHLQAPPRFPEDAPVSAELVALLRAMLTKAPERRLRDAEEVVRCLSRLLGELAPEPPSASRLTLLRPQFVDHSGALARLSKSLEATLNGSCQRVLLTAPSGAGKTRLLNELGARAAPRSMVISCQAATTSSSDETTLANPGLSLLKPLIDYAAHVYRRVLADPVPSHDSERWHGVARSLALGGAAAEAAQPAAPQSARRIWFDALEQLLGLLASHEPVVLLLDDLQWADDLSLAFLLERASAAPGAILFVCSARDDAPPEQLAALRAWALLEVAIPPLERRETGELLKDLLGAEWLPEGLLDYVVARAEGNPFFVGEYLRSALALALLRRDVTGEWQFPTASELEGMAPIPHSIDGLIQSRLGAASAGARQLLAQAAVLGREFDAGLLESSLNDPFATARALEELAARQLLVPVAAARFRFVHDRVRETAERSLSSDVRQSLHRQAALALEKSESRRETSTLARLGFHWAGAAEPRLALEYLVRGAESARNDGDVEFSCQLYRAAVQQAHQLTAAESVAISVSLEESLADVLLLRARHAEARQCYQRAFEIARNPLHRARLKRKEAATRWTQHDYAGAEQLLGDAEHELGTPSREVSAVVWQEHIQIQLGRFEYLYFSQRSGAEIDRLVQTLEEPVAAYGTPRQKNAYYVASSSHHLLRNRYAYSEKAVELSRLAVAASERLTLDQQALGRLSHAFALFFGTPRDCREAVPHMSFAVGAAREARDTTLLARATTYSILTLLRLRDVDGVERSLDDMAAAAEAANLPPYIGAGIAVRGWLGWRKGSDAPGELLEKARATWLAHRHPFPFRWVAGFPLLALATARDDFAAAAVVLTDLTAPGQQALPAPLVSAVAAAAAACSTDDYRRMHGACTKVTALAEELHYC